MAEKKKTVQTRLSREGKLLKFAKAPEAKEIWSVYQVEGNDDPKRFSANVSLLASFETQEQADHYVRRCIFNWMDDNMMLDPENTEMEDTIRQRFIKGEMTTKEMRALAEEYNEPEFSVLGVKWCIEKTQFYPIYHDFCRFNEPFVQDEMNTDE